MDNTIIIYLGKVSISLVVFYLLYHLLFRKDTFFRLRRFYFLSVIFFSVLYPLFNIEILPDNELDKSAIPIYWLSQFDHGEFGVSALASQGSTFDSWTVIYSLMITVSVALFLRFLFQLFSILVIYKKSETEHNNGYKIKRISNTEIAPFSFFSWIFIGSQSQDISHIIRHERVHVNQYHSLDVLLVEFLSICLWWNPIVWLIKNEVKANLEYLADQGAIKKGLLLKEYQYKLLQVSNRNTGMSIINNFNVSQLKKRIMMMNKRKSPFVASLKYLLAIPIGCIFILGNAVQASPAILDRGLSELSNFTKINLLDDQKTEPIAKVEDLQSPQKKNTPPPPPRIFKYGDREIYLTPTEMPKYPGGEKAMQDFVVENLKYPKTAQEANIQGRVTLRFVVSKTGKITDATVIRGIDAECDKEALRVVNTMPGWIPGKEKGVVVETYYTLPIVFRLKNKKVNVKSLSEGTTGSNKPAFVVVEQMPKYPGGDHAMQKFIAEHLKYPEAAQKADMEGRVTIRFIITKEGEVKEPAVIRSLSDECDKEAIRVVKMMPKWEPGKQNGQAVDVYFSLPIKYSLEKKTPTANK